MKKMVMYLHKIATVMLTFNL